MIDVIVEHEKIIKRRRTSKTIDGKVSEIISPHAAGKEKESGDQFFGQNTSEKNLDIHFQQPMTTEADGPANCQSDANCMDAGPINHRGAKRRKSGCVRRFTQDVTSVDFDYLANTAPLNISSCDRVEDLMLVSPDAYRKKFDSSRSSSVITRLIKPISYSASVTNNVQDVSVTFVAMRYVKPSSQ